MSRSSGLKKYPIRRARGGFGPVEKSKPPFTLAPLYEREKAIAGTRVDFSVVFPACLPLPSKGVVASRVHLTMIVKWYIELWVVFHIEDADPSGDGEDVARPMSGEEVRAMETLIAQALSPAQVYALQMRMQEAARVNLRECCENILHRLPASWQHYAIAWDWDNPASEDWRLPQFVEAVAHDSLRPRGYRAVDIRIRDLREYGFATSGIPSFAKLEQALAELKEAWRGLIEIEWELGTEERMDLRFRTPPLSTNS